MYSLPSEFPREPGLPDVYHDLQPALLSATLRLTNYGAENRFTGSDLNLYYDKAHRLWHKRPDWFLALDVPYLYNGTDLRESYVAWDEKETHPYLIVELLSPGTAKQDLGPFYHPEDEMDPGAEEVPEMDHYLEETESDSDSNGSNGSNGAETGSSETQRVKPPAKWTVYQDILRVPNYVVFDRRSSKLWFFKLVDGKYERQPVDRESPRLWFEDLQIGLGVWEGEYNEATQVWLRWFDAAGDWIPTPEEEAERERQEKLQERQRADEAERRAALLLERLKQQGIDVDLDDL